MIEDDDGQGKRKGKNLEGGAKHMCEIEGVRGTKG